MSNPSQTPLANSLPSGPIPSLEDVFFQPLKPALESCGATRDCPVIDDAGFVELAVLRALESSKTGRDFIQTHGMFRVEGLTRSNYFRNLASQRRLDMMLALERELQRQQLPGLRAHDDLLASLPELDGMEIWAADGHKIVHATHDPRNGKGAYNPITGIYKLDLRTGWSGFMDLARPTSRGTEHEITTLKRLDKQELRCGAGKGRSTLFIYDSAIVDFQFAYNLKQSKSVYVVTDWKDNFVPMTLIPREIDRSNPANELVVSDETARFNNTPGTWRKIVASNPDNGEIRITFTNQMTLSPGALNQCRRIRWNIEKSFNQQEQKLDERKAWSASEIGKRIQALAICLAHNLIKLFHSRVKTDQDIEDTKVINAWNKDLVKRIETARQAGRQLPGKLYQALHRPTEASLQFIRCTHCDPKIDLLQTCRRSPPPPHERLFIGC